MELKYVAAGLVLAGSWATAACSATDATDDAQSDTAPVVAGKVWTECDFANLLRTNGWPESAIPAAVYIAKAESRLHERSVNDNGFIDPATGRESIDYGLMQINNAHLREKDCGTRDADLYDPTRNVKCGLQIYLRAGKRFRDWATYSSAADRYKLNCGPRECEPTAAGDVACRTKLGNGHVCSTTRFACIEGCHNDPDCGTGGKCNKTGASWKCSPGTTTPDDPTTPPDGPTGEGPCAGKEEGWYCKPADEQKSYHCTGASVTPDTDRFCLVGSVCTSTSKLSTNGAGVPQCR